MSNGGDLFMLRIPLRTQRLFDLGRRKRLPLRDVDLDYLVHCQLGELFGDRAPAPFRIVQERGRQVDVLAYGRFDATSLEEHARAFADPGAWDACVWERLAGKPMPKDWAAGRRVGFEVRICPVVRKSSSGLNHRSGAEVDAFVSRCWEAPGEDVDRERVYREWLERGLEEKGASLVEGQLERFRLARLLRRRQGTVRSASVLSRPDALLRGVLEVTDGQAFRLLLASGLGRHKAFGFGMLLLRPA